MTLDLEEIREESGGAIRGILFCLIGLVALPVLCVSVALIIVWGIS